MPDDITAEEVHVLASLADGPDTPTAIRRRILVDAAFPQAIEGPHGDGRHVIDRYRGTDIGDRALVRYAHDRGYEALVFLGAGALAEQDVVVEARALPLTVAVTYEIDPDSAQAILKSRLDDLSHWHGSGMVIVRSKGVAPVDPPLGQPVSGGRSPGN